MKIAYIIIAVLLALLVIACLVPKEKEIIEKEIYLECNGTEATHRKISSMEVEALEIVAEVNEYYYYNESNQHTYLKVDELKRLGGTCWHWGEHMKKLAQDRGYVGVSPEVNLMQTGRHQKAEMSSGQGYCVLDSTEARGAFVVGCWP